MGRPSLFTPFPIAPWPAQPSGSEQTYAGQNNSNVSIDEYLVTYLSTYGFPRQKPVSHHAWARIARAAQVLKHKPPTHHDPMVTRAVRLMVSNHQLATIHLAAGKVSLGLRTGKRVPSGYRFPHNPAIGPGWKPTDPTSTILHSIHAHTIKPPAEPKPPSPAGSQPIPKEL